MCHHKWERRRTIGFVSTIWVFSARGFVAESAVAIVFCDADEAALFRSRDEKVHMCNKLASRHVRVGLANPNDVPHHLPLFVLHKATGTSKIRPRIDLFPVLLKNVEKSEVDSAGDCDDTHNANLQMEAFEIVWSKLNQLSKMF